MRISFLVLILLFFGACSSQQQKTDFSNFGSGIQFKYLQFGEGLTLDSADFVLMNVLITDTVSDTLYYVIDFPYFFKLEEDSLSLALRNRRVGDSGIYRLNKKNLLKFYPFDRGIDTLADNQQLNVYFRIKQNVHSESIGQLRKELLFERKLKEQKQLHRYLKQNSSRVDTIDGVYRIIKESNPEGEPIKIGSRVKMGYIGKFLNGYEFERSSKGENSPVFVYGKEFQLIEGIELALKGIKSGEKVKIILPSQHAFGEAGSTMGIVPPNTAVIFEIYIKKVTN